jgi:hypothetical protein
MPGTTEKMQKAKVVAKAQFGALDGVEGIGIGAAGLVIYVRDEATATKIPLTIDGVNVKTIVTGDISGGVVT